MGKRIIIIALSILFVLLIIVGISYISKKNSPGYHGAGALHEYRWICENCDHKNLTLAPELGHFVCEKCGTALSERQEARMGHQSDNGITTGGRTDYSNPDAPKEIMSQNIVSFHACFFAYDMSGDDSATGEHDIRIIDNDKGEHILTVSGVYSYEGAIDNQVLADIQEIIDKYDLVKNNGAGYVTAGLAPECQPWELSVVYDSGEKLYFYEDGRPDAEWTATLRDYFVSIMNSEDK